MLTEIIAKLSRDHKESKIISRLLIIGAVTFMLAVDPADRINDTLIHVFITSSNWDVVRLDARIGIKRQRATILSLSPTPGGAA